MELHPSLSDLSTPKPRYGVNRKRRGQKPLPTGSGFGKATGRYFAKILSALIIGIGFLMVAFSQRKQGLHDILAGTLVVRGQASSQGPDRSSTPSTDEQRLDPPSTASAGSALPPIQPRRERGEHGDEHRTRDQHPSHLSGDRVAVMDTVYVELYSEVSRQVADAIDVLVRESTRPGS